MIAALIALVCQTRDQFEAHGELNACCASRKLPGSLHQSGLTSLKQCLLAKGRVREVNGVEPASPGQLKRRRGTRYLDSPPTWRGNYQSYKRFNTE